MPSSQHPVHLAAIGRLQACLPAGQRLCVGIDTVQISALQASLDDFGDRFAERLFTGGERQRALRSPGCRAERLAVRFAAKEAALKAFGWSEAGIGWREIEVVGEPGEAPRLALHGKAAARLRAIGATQISLSLSHDGDHACAVVVALADARPDDRASVPAARLAAHLLSTSPSFPA